MKIYLLSTALVIGMALTACQKTQNPAPSLVTGASIEDNAAQILAQMTLEEKIGQVIQADISAVSPSDLKTYNLGSVLNGGNSAPGGGKTASPEAWIALADEFWDASTDTSDGGLGIPAIWGTDAVHGHNNLQNATIFPHNSALGAANDEALIREIGEVTAREIRATGIDWTFAPTLAVARDDRWGRAYESYSENPDIVARFAKAMVEGLQGETRDKDFLVGEHVVATAKHFVGDGGTQYGIDKGDTLGDMDALLEMHAAGYQPAIDAGVQTVMASFSSINGEKMHGSKNLLTDVLRGEMGFGGFVVGDWNGHAEVPGCTAIDCPESLEAGVDMYMAPDTWKGLYGNLLAQAKSGELSMDALDQAVTRILQVKIRAGLFDAGRPSTRASSQISNLGTEKNADVARRAVRQSLVLLKNADQTLPIAPGKTVLIAGSGADSMQQQTGGWTLNWQGDGNPNEIFETGETIYAGLKDAITATGGTAVLSETGQYSDAPDVAIVVFGEQPYAEYRGDRSDLVFEFENGENLALIKRLKAKNIPVVSVFLTGRPLWMNAHLNASDAFVVGWLPGTEGGGIADVLVAGNDGKARHDFTGRLSFSWPADGTAKPINDKKTKDVLFGLGHGLSYSDDGTLATLSENPGVTASSNFAGSIMARGDAASPFGFYLGDSSNLNTPATELVSASLGGVISTRGVDYKAQEDARQITWSGKGKARAAVRTLRPIDMSDIADDKNMAVQIEWRMDEMPSAPMHLTMGCGDGCESTLDVTQAMSQINPGTWAKTSIALSCFDKLDASKIDTPLRLSTEGKASVTLHSVKLTKTEAASSACPS